jgi:peptidyl-tRNA hydrolase, PTH1 family
MKLLVGLGNPGEKYARNRHNVGFMALQTIAKEYRFPAWKKRFGGMAAEGEIAAEKCLLLMPLTYMNDSGRSVGEAARFLKLATSDIIVVHDEIDLAPAKLKVKTGGGVAGHNGLRSITQHLDNEYVRVRIGVGHPGSKDAVHHYVLGDFHKSEFAAWVDPMLAAMAKAAGSLVKGQADKFMSEVALLLQPEDERKVKRSAPQAEPGAPKQDPVKRHPAGESEAKRVGAMADNLKKWLAGRGKGGV